LDGLNLLGTPCIVGLAHIWRRLYRGNVFQRDICDTNGANDGAGDDARDFAFENDRPNEDVDWISLGVTTFMPLLQVYFSQIPRPKKENKKDAWRDR
jgi:hypothetical protein